MQITEAEVVRFLAPNYTKSSFTNENPQNLSPTFSLNTFTQDSTSWTISRRIALAEYRRLHDIANQQKEVEPVFSPREVTKQEVDPTPAQ